MQIERVKFLNEKEIEDFKSNYILINDMEISEVSLLVYGSIKEYLINDIFFLRDYGNGSLLFYQA